VLALSLEYGIDVPLRRPVEDFGEKSYPDAPTATVRCARRWDSARRVLGDEGGRAFTQSGRLYVYRDADVRDGDKISLPEGDVIVRGYPENDMLNALDGNDFGVKRFVIERS
jgi:hypothetical protein